MDDRKYAMTARQRIDAATVSWAAGVVRSVGLSELRLFVETSAATIEDVRQAIETRTFVTRARSWRIERGRVMFGESATRLIVRRSGRRLLFAFELRRDALRARGLPSWKVACDHVAELRAYLVESWIRFAMVKDRSDTARAVLLPWWAAIVYPLREARLAAMERED